MSLKLFNPFARYVVIQTGSVYYPGECGYCESIAPITPVHYTDDLEDAEKVAYGLGKAKEGHEYYEVRENAAWKALDKRRATLKATGYGDAGELPGIDTQLGIAAEVLHDMLEPPSYPEETYCEKCEQKTGSFTKTLCPDCERYAATLGRKCVCCGGTSCVPGTNLCGLCKAAETMARQDRERRQQEEFRQRRRNMGTALERTDAPDTPTAKPEGHGTWTK